MVAQAEQTTTASSPLQQSVERVLARVKYAQITLGSEHVSVENGWYRASEVVENPEMVAELVRQVGSLYEMDDRQVSASFLILGYFWYPWAAAVACYLLDQRVPEMDAAHVALSLRQGVTFMSPRCYVLPDDPLADHPDAIVVADRQALRAQLARDMTSTHAAPLFKTLRTVAPYGVPAMRANYIDRMASAILYLASELGYQEIAQEEVAAFVALAADGWKARTSSQWVAIEDKRDILLLRAGCCLNYRREGGEHCADCSLLPLDERITRLQQYILNPEAHEHDHDHDDDHAHDDAQSHAAAD